MIIHYLLITKNRSQQPLQRQGNFPPHHSSDIPGGTFHPPGSIPNFHIRSVPATDQNNPAVFLLESLYAFQTSLSLFSCFLDCYDLGIFKYIVLGLMRIYRSVSFFPLFVAISARFCSVKSL